MIAVISESSRTVAAGVSSFVGVTLLNEKKTDKGQSLKMTLQSTYECVAATDTLVCSFLCNFHKCI